MAQLIVRNIDATTVAALKRRAAARGHSAEAEHREILRRALTEQAPVSLKEHLLNMPNVGSDNDFKLKRFKARRVKL
jgi:plasmid stability protein